MDEVRTGYDRVAGEYAAEFHSELAKKPFDRKMLDWLIEKVADLGPICDLGCGPGQAARYLHDHGAAACGIDLSDEMVRCARSLNPGVPFEQGDMLALSRVADASFGGIAALYSIIHVRRDRVVEALSELRRVLRPGGVLLLAFHIGDHVVRRDEWWGKTVCIDFFFHQTAEMKTHLRTAGFELSEVIERDPYPDVEYQSRRAYIFSKPRG
jgi:SAM-dependent methyltransferase